MIRIHVVVHTNKITKENLSDMKSISQNNRSKNISELFSVKILIFVSLALDHTRSSFINYPHVVLKKKIAT